MSDCFTIDTAFYNWRVSTYYKYFTWGSLYTNKDVFVYYVFLNRLLKFEGVYILPFMVIFIILVMIICFHYHSVLSYDNIALPQQMRSNLTDMGVTTPTPIQMESVSYQQSSEQIPCILSNRDVLLRSNTGSGKTLAYLIPLTLLQLDYVRVFTVVKNSMRIIKPSQISSHSSSSQAENQPFRLKRLLRN